MFDKVNLAKILNKTAVEYFKSIIYAIILALLFRSFFFMPFKIPSGSMIPNLQVGDYLLVSKYSYGYSRYSFPLDLKFIDGRIFAKSPQRGDIIVFKSPKPDNNDIYYIKRLIGIPGDEVQVKNGILYINGTSVPKISYDSGTSKLNQNNIEAESDIFEEILPNGVKYSIISASNKENSEFPNQTPLYKVPHGHYFFMGDNRDNSIDSRFLNDMGFIPQENLIGKAEILYWTKDFSVWEFITQFNIGRVFKNL